jgi:dTDP-4-dehydrorhamnose reductase
VAVDLQAPQTLRVLERMAPDALVVALTPTRRDAEGYEQGFAAAMRAIVAGLGAHRPRRAFFISSTRVYAESDGGWVDETSPLAGHDPQAAAIIAAERYLLDAVEGALVLRAGGLYSDSSVRMIRRVAEGILTPAMPLRYSNRIHRDDLAAFLDHALNADEPVPSVERVINLVDTHPASMQEFEEWLCAELGVDYAPPPVEEGTPAAGHKRVRSRVLSASGFRLAYATYRQGYARALAQWQASPPS